MKKVTIGVVLGCLLGLVFAMGSVTPALPAGYCLDVMPICRPGTVPICICESDISLRCGWTCGSLR